MNELALFAGAGGGILGGHLLGWRTVCAVEYDRYARSVLIARQNDGTLNPFPIWDDVRTFDGHPWRGVVDIISGGFPCQDISVAGKGAGIAGSRSGLWSEMARIVGEVRPRLVWVENSSLLVRRGLGLVLADLAKLGFSARWGIVGARHAGAPHRRDRIWILAYADSLYKGERIHAEDVPSKMVVGRNELGGSECHEREGCPSFPLQGGDLAYADGAGREAQRLCSVRSGEDRQTCVCSGEGELADADGAGCQQQRLTEPAPTECKAVERGCWWETEPELGRVADGVASRVDRLRCIGNGQVPAVVRLAWETLRV